MNQPDESFENVPEPELSIVIPALNESDAIQAVLEDIHSNFRGLHFEVIVVDDGSTDETGSKASLLGARVIRHAQTKGYGAALKTGIRQARGEYVLTMDADGQHRGSDALRLWQERADNDMVVGQRQGIIHSSLWRMPGKWLLGWLANYLTRQRIPDLNSGMRLFRRATILKYLHICPSGFSFSTTSTMALFNRGCSVAYIPIEVNKRIGKSTVSIGTGIDTLILILRIAVLFDPLRLFIPISVSIGLVGAVWNIPYFLSGRGIISTGSTMTILTAVLVFGLGLLCDQISQLRLERYE
jgi:glycosyltransferase involved in cell wall biosynthesis